jgi:hypothetical protein
MQAARQQPQLQRNTNTVQSRSTVETTGYRFNYPSNAIDATVKFNSMVDRMSKEGWIYVSHMQISSNDAIIIFQR